MTKHEMEATADWLHFCELMTNATIRKYADFAGVDADLRGQILKEQGRRRRELRKLRNSIEAEITAKRGRGRQPMPHRTQPGSRRTMSESERQRRREAIQAAGGWFLYARQQRQAREQASATTAKEGLSNAKAAILYQEEAPKVP